MTSISSISRPNGALITTTIIKPNVFTRITFKISGEDQIYSDMIPSSVKTGKVELSSPVTKKAAKGSNLVLLAMVGKNSNFIH